ncbi:MAG: hypothetical protein ABWJ42_03945 [Sulfolobales archaeon]
MGEEELLERSRAVKPVYAMAFFNISPRSLDYYIVFEYEDPMEYYREVISDKDLYERELEMLADNMQTLLDQEIVRFNKEIVKPEVRLVDIGFKERYKKPYILFKISSKISLVAGRNEYENIYESTVTAYDYVSYWSLPREAKVHEVIMDGVWEVERENIIIYVSRGTRVKGYEKIVFYI